MSPPSGAGVDSSEEADMHEFAIFISIFTGIFVAIFLAFLPLLPQWTAAEDRARARRLADAKMNARLLRLNL
jgi:hypothetical protein